MASIFRNLFNRNHRVTVEGRRRWWHRLMWWKKGRFIKVTIRDGVGSKDKMAS
jgi:ABC-type antimicrobial peptide transport system ATPase subunit